MLSEQTAVLRARPAARLHAAAPAWASAGHPNDRTAPDQPVRGIGNVNLEPMRVLVRCLDAISWEAADLSAGLQPSKQGPDRAWEWALRFLAVHAVSSGTSAMSAALIVRVCTCSSHRTSRRIVNASRMSCQ